MQNITARLLLAVVKFSLQVFTLSALLGISALAQSSSNTDGTTPLSLTPGAPAGSYALSGLEHINLFNGNLNFSLPLLSVGGRGDARMQMTLPIDQRWRTESYYYQYGAYYIYSPNYNWWTGLKAGYGPGVLHGRTTVLATYDQCYPDGSWITASRIVTRLTFTAPDGTEFELRDQLTGGRPLDNAACVAQGPSRGTVFVSGEGSAATFVSDTTIYDNVFTGTDPNPIFFPTGYLMLKNGVRYRIQNGLVMWMRDRNGNKLTFAYDDYAPNYVPANRVISITDSVNRQITISYDVQDVSPYGLCDKIQFHGFGGATRTIRVSKNSLGNALRPDFTLKTYYQLFPEFNGSCSYCTHNPTVTSAVWLPDGRSYSFFYNSYSELARVKLPTGGSFEYDYGPGISNGPASGMVDESSIYRRVVEKRSYTDDNVLAGRSVFSRPESFGGAPYYTLQTTGFVDLDTLDLYGNRISRGRHYFYGIAADHSEAAGDGYPYWQSGREYKTEQMDVNGSTVLRRTIQTWQQRAPVPWWGSWCPSYYCYGHPEWEPPNDPRMTESRTELTDTNPAQVSTQVYGYDDSVPFNNQNNVKEYDYGSSAPGALLRETRTTYVTSSNYTGTSVHLRSLPAQTSVFDGGGVERARTTYEYDNYASDSYHAALVDRPSISGLDSSFNTSYTTRGNVTAVTRSQLNSSGYVIGSIPVYSQCDIAGNVVKTIDGRGIATNIDFSDRFGAPDGDARANAGSVELNSAGQYSYGFATSQTKAGLTSYTQFDYYLARPVDAEDVNGTTYSGYYNDALDRPTQMIGGANRDVSLKSQTVFSYDDAGRSVTSLRDQSAFTDNLLKEQSFYDGLGRTTETRKYEGGTNYIVTQQQYDLQGRVFRISNPFRPWNGESAVWTTSAFDTLSRTVSVTTPDNAVATTSYSGPTVTTTDQNSKKRKSVSDALGRMTQVYEDPNGVNYLSSYAYDTLDNLTSVNQGGQTRTFVYDSIKRMLSATNPESGTMAYSYDNNGNLLTRTDARNITTTVAYDALNRATSKTYQNDPYGTPAINYFYDGQSLPSGAPSFARGSSLGRLVAITYAGGSAGDYLGYDAIGRSVLKIQQIGGINYPVSAGYNTSGALTSETYPSGHAINYGYDQAGRTSSFTGYLGDGTQRTYSTGISYSPRGSLRQEQFGTDTPVYNKLFYNARGQVAEIRESTTPNNTSWNRGAIINHYSYQCWGMCSGYNMPDNNNTLKKQEVYIPDDEQISSYKTWWQNYGYDNLNRLTQVNEYTGNGSLDWQQAYTIDQWGNRTIDYNNTSPTIPRPQFGVDTGTNRLTAPGGYTMTYDAAGNLTNDTYTGEGQRTYDAENRMTQAWANGQWQTYAYDGNGQRVRRNVNGAETWQVFGFGGGLLAEYAANSPASTPKKEYGYRNGQLLVQTTVPQTSGGGLTGQYYDNMDFTALRLTRTDPTVNFDWGNGSPSAAIGVDSFTVRWTGQVQPLYSQTYTLYTQSDDGVRLWINGQLIIDNWTDHGWTENSGQITLTAGQKYDVQMEFYENGGGAVAKLLWSSASQAKQPISQSQLYPDAGGKGLNGQYFDNMDFTNPRLARTDATVGFDWGGGTPSAAIGADTFTVRWTGQVKPLYSQTYTFYTQSDDGVRLWVNGQLVVDNWTDHGWTENSGQITLTAGQWYDIKMEFYENGGGAVAKLLWSSANQTKEIIPGNQLSTGGGQSANSVEWMVTDHLGTPRMVFDKTGSLAGMKRHDYLPFGEDLAAGQGARTTVQGYSIPDDIRQKFTNQERDNETGLDFFSARYYASAQGRFTSPDPLLASGRAHHPQSWNRYTYVLNNPARLTDPSGLRSNDPDGLGEPPPPPQQTPPAQQPPPPPPPAQQPAPPQPKKPISSQSATAPDQANCSVCKVTVDQVTDPSLGKDEIPAGSGKIQLDVGVVLIYTFTGPDNKPVQGTITEKIIDRDGGNVIQNPSDVPLNPAGQGKDLVSNAVGPVPRSRAELDKAAADLNKDFTTRQLATFTFTPTGGGPSVNITQERTLTNTVPGAPPVEKGFVRGYTFTMEKPKIGQ